MLILRPSHFALHAVDAQVAFTQYISTSQFIETRFWMGPAFAQGHFEAARSRICVTSPSSWCDAPMKRGHRVLLTATFCGVIEFRLEAGPLITFHKLASIARVKIPYREYKIHLFCFS